MLSPRITDCEELVADLSIPQKVCLQPVADIEQLRELWLIDKAAYRDQSLELEEFSQWWQRYPMGSRVLLYNHRIVAAIGIYPLYEMQANMFIQGILPENELLPVTVNECQQQLIYRWYFSGIVVAEDMRGWNSPLRKLLQFGLSAWLESGHVSYPLEVISIAEYESGRRLSELLGFQKIREGNQMVDGYDLYGAHFNSKREAVQSFRLRSTSLSSTL